MEFAFYLLLLIVAIVIDYIIARAFADAAEDKGYPDGKYFWFCFLFGPAGYLLVIALPDRGKTAPAAAPAPAAYSQPQTPAPHYPNAAPTVRHPSDPTYTSPAPQAVQQVYMDGSWQCTCGRKNPRYVSTCVCGKNKYD